MNMLKKLWLDYFQNEVTEDYDWWTRKRKLVQERRAEIIRINGEGHIFQNIQYDNRKCYRYLLHLSFLMRQQDYFYVEEMVIPYQIIISNGKVIEHKEIPYPTKNIQSPSPFTQDEQRPNIKQRDIYDRLAAVKYAEHWWNSYNPAYQKFNVDCTNYISQCLRAGGAPMRGMPDRGKGWWYQANNWSFSWAVAHSLRWYLSGSTEGLQGKEVDVASDLYPGDVICYDFQGDGRWDHNTIVVAKDANGMPLVNAHTDNSRHRYWSYEDSTAWTPEIKYKFFRISVS